MMNYKKDREHSDLYLSEIIKILEPLKKKISIEISSDEIDQNEAADLVFPEKRIACRIRSSKFIERYLDEFTIRASRISGATTEFEKINDGYADWMFYGFIGEGPRIYFKHWKVIDLDAFRYHQNNNLHLIDWKKIFNEDQSTGFHAYKISSFPDTPPIIIASSDMENEE